MTSNPFNFQHFNINYFALNVKGRQIRSEGLTLNPADAKSSVMAYNTLFEGSGIHHSNSGLTIKHDMYIKGYFMLVYDLPPDLAASQGHTSHADNGNIRIDMRFEKALTDAITCLHYLEYNNTIFIDKRGEVSTYY